MDAEPDLTSSGVSAYLSRQYATEQKDFFVLLVPFLRNMIPTQVQVKEKGLFKKTIESVSVSQGEGLLTLSVGPTGALSPCFTRVVRGIALKTEPLSMDEWLALLSESLEQSANQNMEARQALSRFLGLP